LQLLHRAGEFADRRFEAIDARDEFGGRHLGARGPGTQHGSKHGSERDNEQ